MMGRLNLLKKKLLKLGFKNTELLFESKKHEKVLNLFSILKNSKKNSRTLCFAGHTDVVPPGDLKAWKYDPFIGKTTKDKIYGRGSSDMKGAISAWINACENVLSKQKLSFSLALMITGDEEGVAENGTKKIVSWIKKKNKYKSLHCRRANKPKQYRRYDKNRKKGKSFFKNKSYWKNWPCRISSLS